MIRLGKVDDLYPKFMQCVDGCLAEFYEFIASVVHIEMTILFVPTNKGRLSFKVPLRYVRMLLGQIIVIRICKGEGVDEHQPRLPTLSDQLCIPLAPDILDSNGGTIDANTRQSCHACVLQICNNLIGGNVMKKMQAPSCHLTIL